MRYTVHVIYDSERMKFKFAAYIHRLFFVCFNPCLSILCSYSQVVYCFEAVSSYKTLSTSQDFCRRLKKPGFSEETSLKSQC